MPQTTTTTSTDIRIIYKLYNTIFVDCSWVQYKDTIAQQKQNGKIKQNFVYFINDLTGENADHAGEVYCADRKIMLNSDSLLAFKSADEVRNFASSNPMAKAGQLLAIIDNGSLALHTLLDNTGALSDNFLDIKMDAFGELQRLSGEGQIISLNMKHTSFQSPNQTSTVTISDELGLELSSNGNVIEIGVDGNILLQANSGIRLASASNSIDFNGKNGNVSRLTNVAAPTLANDATPKQYVDEVVEGSTVYWETWS